MSVHTKTPPTDEMCAIQFVGPKSQSRKACEVLARLGFRELQESIPWRDAFPDLTDEKLPGVALRGLRYREGMTQVALSKMTGIPQRHLSEMENGKRAIGKDRAKKLAKILSADYRILL